MRIARTGLGSLVAWLALLTAACGGGSSSTGSASTTTGSGGAGAGGSTSSSTTGSGGSSAGAKVFLILMENHNWSDVKGSASAPYINGLLATGAHAEHYENPPGNHPSEPNYLWLEAGTNFGVDTDLPPPR